MDTYSPKSSPRVSVASNPMETGSNPLKLSIALGPGGQKPTIIQKGPFYLMKPDPLPRSEITGATNLMASKGLEHSYVKLTSKLYMLLFWILRFFETLQWGQALYITVTSFLYCQSFNIMQLNYLNL